MRTRVAAGVVGLVVLGGCAAPDASRSLDTAAQRRVVEWKDVPGGRGQTRRVPFWVPAEETERPGGATADVTSSPPEQRRVEWRDVPQGRGQTRRIPFWVRGTE